MGKYNASAILAAFGTTSNSFEENDLNINIQAEHEGDGDDDGAGDDLFEESVDNGDDAGAEAVDTSSTPETAEIDVAESAEATGATADKIQDVDETVTGLENLALQLATISQEGIEVTPFIANTINAQYDYITRRYPALSRSRLDSNSFESYGYGVETLSFEGAMDKIKSTAASVVKMLKQLWLRIKAFFGSGIAAATVARQKAAKLINGKARKKPATEVKVPSILKDGLGVAKINELSELVKLVTHTRVTVFEQYSESNGGGSNLADFIAAMNRGVDTYLKRQTMPGNFKIIRTADNILKVDILDDDKAVKDKPRTPAEIKEEAKAIWKLCDNILSYRKGEPERKKVNDKLITIIGNTSTTNDPNKLTAYRLHRKAASLWARQCAWEQQVMRRALAYVNAYNNLLAASL